jgi:SSS family solute:Na+ symporter
VIGGILLGGVVAALYAENLLTLFQYFISLPAVFGAPIWLGFVWRRLTKSAVIAQVIICFSLYAIIPNLFPSVPAVRSHPALLAETTPRQVMVVTGALEEDVEAGRASEVGETIRKPHLIEATGIYFERVVRTDPADPNSALEGQGRFHAEIWVLSWIGIDFSSWSKAQLVATRFFFDALFPFVLLFLISAFTKPVDKTRLDRFYGKLHTPVQPSVEEDVAEVERAALHPEDFEPHKIWRGSNWEVLRPGKIDILGFGGSWVLVGVVLVLLWLLATIGT